MKHIEKVRVFESISNYHNGEDLGPGFTVLVEPQPKTEHETWVVAQAITNALNGLKLETE